MLVVNTTSATVMSAVPWTTPRKRVPSSRRRNPGTSTRSVTMLWLGRGRRRGGGRVAAGRSVARRRGGGGERNGAVRVRRRRRRRGDGGRRECLVEHRRRRALLGGHQRQHVREEEKDPAAPPARLGEQVARLPRAEERIRRAAHPAEAGRQAIALAALHQDGRDE